MIPASSIQKSFESVVGLPDDVKGREHSYPCPFCNPKGASHIHVNFVKNAATCHRCGYGTRNLVNMLRAVGASDVPYARSFPRTGYLRKVEDLLFPPKLPKVSLPPEFVPLSVKDSRTRLMRNYLVNLRGVTNEQIDDLGIGCCHEGRYSGCVIFPCVQGGHLVYFTARRVLGDGGKSLNPELPRDSVLFNYDRCYDSERVVIVEGPISALKSEQAGFSTCALLGHRVSDGQARLITCFPNAVQYVLAVDPGVPARVLARGAQTLRAFAPPSADILMVELDGGDPAELPVEAYRQQIEFASLFDDAARLRAVMG